MQTSLHDMRAAARTNLLTWQGTEVSASFTFAEVPRRFTVRFVSGIDQPVQGVFLDLKGGLLRVDGVEHSRFALWSPRYPHEVQVETSVSSRGKAQLRVSNAWKRERADQAAYFTDYWTGNSGMVVATEAGRIDLRCSCGIGEVDFTDLLVEIRYDVDASSSA